MGYTVMSSAIVLHTYDIGEADRLCVLLTENYGKILARAYGVRLCKSHIGGILLPLQRVSITLYQSQKGWCVREAKLVHPCRHPCPMLLQQGVEILLLLLEDEEPVPGIFALTGEFVDANLDMFIPFVVRLFHIMGVLPMEDSDSRFKKLSHAGKRFIYSCIREESLQSLEDILPIGDRSLVEFCDALLHEQLPRPLQSRGVVSAMQLR